MAITNKMLVLMEQIRLFKAGLLAADYSNMITIEINGKQEEIPDIEAIHTYQYWKSIGYYVKPGEKHISELMIWKYTTKRTNDDNTNADNIETSKMIMTKAYFFKASQVEKIKPIQRITAAEIVGKPMTITINKKRKTRKEA